MLFRLLGFLLLFITMISCQTKPEEIIQLENRPLHSVESEVPSEINSDVPSILEQPLTPIISPEESWLSQTLSEMSEAQLVGQMMFLSLRQWSSPEENKVYHRGMGDYLKDLQPGGVILFQENISTFEGVSTLISKWQEQMLVPLLISVDEEGGLVSRLKSLSPRVPVLPSFSTVSKWDYSTILQKSEALGASLKELGVHMNLAPVADLSLISGGPLGSRSPGAQPQAAAKVVSQVILGLQNQGVSAVIKHFPGLGATTIDTHDSLPTLGVDLLTFQQREAIPFKAGIDQKVDGIMIGHVRVPHITGDFKPAPMSSLLIQGILRDQWNYQGLIITDALEMGGINDGLSPEEVIPAVIEAGVDVLLMPTDPYKTRDILLKALKEGKLSRKRLETSVRRILELKIVRIEKMKKLFTQKRTL